MEMTVKIVRARMRLSGVFVRLSLSRDASPAPCYHRLFLDDASSVKLKWKVARPTSNTALIWEACVIERAPTEEGGEAEPVIVGGAVTPTRGRHEIEIRDFYADAEELIGTLEVEIEGLEVIAAPTPDPAEDRATLARLQGRYEDYYRRATPTKRRDRFMRVPTFKFYGAEVQASYLAILRGEMDRRFARSALEIVLEEAGMTEREFVDAGERQLESEEYLQETTAIAARIGEFATFTANLMRYRADVTSPVFERRELIEKIVPHVREERGGDCEDLALEIYFCFHALRSMSPGRDPLLRVAIAIAFQYVPFLATTVATAPAAGGSAEGGDLLHVFAVALAREHLEDVLPPHYASVAATAVPWAGGLPNLAPLEGTNWCDALHLPIDRYYGGNAEDASALLAIERSEKLAIAIAPEMRKHPTRIRQRLGASLDEEGFSGFYRRVTELWGDFSRSGSCCFSVVDDSTGRYGVGLGEIAAKGAYHLEVVFEHSGSERWAVQRAMNTTAPIPEWKGRIRSAPVPRPRSGARPRRASRLHSDTIVYHFRSEALFSSARVQRALRALEERFDVSWRAWKLPPEGQQKYVAVYARRK